MYKTRLLTRYPLKFAIKDITETVKSLFSRCLISTNKVNLIDDPGELRNRTSIYLKRTVLLALVIVKYMEKNFDIAKPPCSEYMIFSVPPAFRHIEVYVAAINKRPLIL